MSLCGWSHQDPCTIVTIGDIEAVSNGPKHGYGLLSLDGWEGGAPAKGGPVGYEHGDGGIRGDVYYAGRVLIIEGDILARDHEELADMVGALSSLDRFETLVVDEAVHTGHVRQVEVSRMRPVQITTHGTTYATWTMTLQTVDWRRISVDLQSVPLTTGGVQAVNVGTAPANVTVILDGPLTNPGISWPGGAWQYSNTVAAGQRLIVEMEERRIQDPATTDQHRRFASGTWLSLPPGETVVSRTGTGSGVVTFRWRSSWA